MRNGVHIAARRSLLAIVFGAMFLAGCRPADQYRALEPPEAEAPTINPHFALRQANWLGGPRKDEGSCVHASLSTVLHWQNKFELAKSWRQTYDGGEYSSRLRERLDRAGIKYAFTEQGNLGLLDFAHQTRRGAIIWWKPSHCCTFCGWVESGGKIYAAIIDNNRTQSFEFVEKSQFHRLWAGYGGFALTPLFDPPSPPVYKSFEKVSSARDADWLR